jgi:lysophospholipase L1-like esterase
VDSVLSSGRLALSWNDVPGAASYDLYISNSPGVTTLNSYKIDDVTTPITITDLEPGTTYYFVVTVYSDSGESRNSKEFSYTVIQTEGSLELGDILIQSDPEEKSTGAAMAAVSTAPEEPKPEPQAPSTAGEKAGSEVIVCFGDSLTFGTGAATGMDYPSQLAGMMGKPIINKGIPGDTTSSALRRLYRDVLSIKPDIVLITLGGNDLKNGVSKNTAFANLKYIVETILERGARVIIGGLKFPGIDRGFGKGYQDLARQTGAILIPDIYAGVVDNPNLMSDAIHPNSAGYRIIARRFHEALLAPPKANTTAGKTPGQPETGKPDQATAVKPGQTAAIKQDRAAQNSVPQTRDVTLAWDDVPKATSYNIYWSDKPGVSRQNGTKISNVNNPHKIKDLIIGKKYYFVVTAVNASGESKESGEFSFTVGQ